MRVLVVEDNSELAGLLASGLRQAGYEADILGSIAETELALETVDYAALILDLGLPDGNGVDLLKALRMSHNALPVLVLTARSGVEDKVKGFKSGADDYLTKPFAFHELVARLEALLRRPGELHRRALKLGNVEYNAETRELAVAGENRGIAGRESVVLELLLRRAGSVVSKQLIEDEIYALAGAVGSNAVEVYVHRLRKTLADAGADVSIKTVRGLGYLIGQWDKRS
ncbi:response regulator transcription factor [Hyphomicrobium sulfonivorans]|uniref:response regulator n=1 Tax=Hyphomicrobium sulfonivorans TaxID=121290 RepID=UPI00156FE803|nr:response regulator transcription factor [Hyphomicrobium sulfonivorans]MBI1649265.1 response regulator transcription factor [Hyphomicrobium sulfonivorans]NSL70204.1 DNA-binding response regulator [Hyphomicrobium sulfonivorans]